MKKKSILKASFDEDHELNTSFKYTCANCPDLAEKLVYFGCDDGLHAFSLEDGVEAWSFSDPDGNLRGKTPAVDQENEWLYFQQNNRLHKLNARTGAMLIHKHVLASSLVGSGNTVLVNDSHGYHVVVYYQAWLPYGGRIFCYDSNLNLEWSVTGLNSTGKNTLCYHDGLVYMGTGEIFAQGQELWYVGQPEDCMVNAYNISDGSLEWSTLLSDPLKIFEPLGYAVMNIIYCNGYLIAEQSIGNAASGDHAKIHVFDPLTGTILRTYIHDSYLNSCGVISLSNGKLITGDLNTDKMLVFKIGTGLSTDYAPFGMHQTNTMEAPFSALTTLDDSITLLDQIPNGNQGSVINRNIVFACYGTDNKGVVSFYINTLKVIQQYATANSYDSSPIVLQSVDRSWYMLVHENENARTICRRVDDGSLVWYSAANQPGNLFFGYTYFNL